ncbi:hypothetical protein MRX96_000271 [Rhipicephalus microplus]
MVQYMKALSKSKLLDVIALQEPFDRAQLSGYVECGSPCECTGKEIKVCTLVKRETALMDHSLEISEVSDVDHNLIEVVHCIGNRKTDLFVLNAYSPPFKKGPHAQHWCPFSRSDGEGRLQSPPNLRRLQCTAHAMGIWSLTRPKGRG